MSNKFNPDEYIGKKYGKLTIVAYDKERSSADTKWHRHFFFCSCECNPNKILKESIGLNSLENGRTRSCGCKKRKKKVNIEDSVGQFLIEKHRSLEMVWDYEKNGDLNPFEIAKGSHIKVWIKCQDVDYHGSYEIACYSLTKGHGCPFCNGNSGKVHIKDSFGQLLLDEYGTLDGVWDYEKNGDLDPFELTKQSNKKVWLFCQEKDYHGSYKTTCANFYNGQRCPYCCCFHGLTHFKDSVGFNFPDILDIWDDKKNPFETSFGCNQMVNFKCFKHGNYKQKVQYAIKHGLNCPKCTREAKSSSLQLSVLKHLKSFGYKINHEYDCNLIPKNPKTKLPLPFDNEVEELKLIIEVHGSQHYEVVQHFHGKDNGKTPEENFRYQQVKDRYKQYIAWKNGYEYLAIPYWTEQDGSYIELINNKIEEILLNKNIK